MIDLLALEPTTISRDLQSKYILLYGQPKCGKTSFAAQIKNNLIFSFEVGTNALSGIYKVEITKWMDFKKYIRELEKPEVREKFKTITIDTVGIAYSLCEKFVCSQNNVESIGDIPYGKGYALVKKEFEETLRKISMMGLGIILISHSARRVEVQSDDSEIEFFSPELDKRCYAIVNQLVDIIAYIDIVFNEDGSTSRWLYTRRTKTIMAGSRWKYLAPKIPFGYQELVDAIGEAIDKQEKDDGAVVVDRRELNIIERSYEEVRAEAMSLWEQKVTNAPSEQEAKNMADKIMNIVNNVFGQPIKLSNISERQKDLFEDVVDEMRKL